MNIPRLLFAMARLGWVLFLVLTSGYCLLTYIPFTYHEINLGGLFPWLTTFAKYHAYVYWGAFLLVALTLLPDLKNRKTKALTVGFLIFHAVAGVVLLVHPLLANLSNSLSSLVWSLVALVPLAWVAAIDWVGYADRLIWADAGSVEDHRVFRAAWQSAVYVPLVYAAIFSIRYLHAANQLFGGRERLVVLVSSLIDHLVIFMAVFVTVNLVRAVARFFPKPFRVEFLLCNTAAVFVIAAVLGSLVLSAVSFGGALSKAFAVTAALCLAVANAGAAVRFYRPASGPVESGLALLLLPITFGRLSTRRARWVFLAALPVVAYVLAARAAVMDWNYMLQKLAVLLVWAAAFAGFYALAPRFPKKPFPIFALLISAAATVGVRETLKAAETRWGARLAGSQRGEALLDNYAGYDVSFKLIHDMLTPLGSGNTFYRFLSQNTNLPQSARASPVEVNLVETLTESDGPKPHIFIFVVDSLRRDYLSCYNPSVPFTPSLDAFGRESTVMENAFTRYGGTGLSEPSIWVGGMLLHKQYVTPFYPMNSLQKLVQAEKYQSYVTKDPILSVVTGPWPSLIELDQASSGMNYDFCRTLQELTGKLRARRETSRPIFAYTQPQNIHISVINREGRTVPPGESYPGFDAPYASRVRRLDGCFGEFIKFLKSSGLYDQSIVIVTSDHGDSLGENGRWGHAYTIFPEVVRVPLLIHLPPAVKTGLAFDPRAAAFLTDITPSLYYLLGHRPIARNEVFGRPLFTLSPEEQASYRRDWQMLASSYGPVYGVLRNGRSLFIADAVNYQDYFFDLGGSAAGTSAPVTPSIRNDNERLIDDEILAINRFYKFASPH